METKEIIKELKNILDDFLNKKLNFDEVIEGIEKLAKSTGIDFSTLYNAFYSSQPEIYF
jgi:IS30 family transposase